MSSVFDKIKEEVPIVEICDLLGIELKSSGVNSIPTDDTCPLPSCGHRGAFRVHPTENFFKCFSCDSKGDGITLFQLVKGLPNPMDAAREIAKEKKIDLPKWSQAYDLYDTVANYYHEQLISSPRKLTLEGRSPLEYQLQQRLHTQESLGEFKVGWSDGRLNEFLYALGIEVEENPFVKENGKDFFGSDFFIYPHFLNGRVSHFTIKDPKKQVAYQLKKANSLGGVLFYNQDSLKDATQVLVVEGENDVISAVEAKFPGAVIGTIGSISGDQVKFLKELAQRVPLFTGFDIDTAGDKYREKVLTGRHLFVPRGKDIDDYLKKNDGSWEELFKTEKTIPQQIPLTKPEVFPISIINGCYYIRREKGDQFWDVPLTNFTIELQNVYYYPRVSARSRPVVFVNKHGKKSRETLISSDEKTSVSAFVRRCADAMDGSFYGNDRELKLLWDYIYSTQDPKEVIIPAGVGHIGKDVGGWLFRNLLITDGLDIIRRSKDGVFWRNGEGIKPESLLSESSSEGDLPEISETSSFEEGEGIVTKFLQQLALNMGPGFALTCVAWAWACVYSNEYFAMERQFPFLLINGKNGKGKSYTARWIASFFGAPEERIMSVSQLKTGAGSLRKMAFYHSIPVVFDELRADKDHKEYYTVFRLMFQRQGRAMASTTSMYAVRNQEINCPVLFAGQDGFESDPALQERCLTVLVPSEHSIPEEQRRKSFDTIKEMMEGDLSKVAYHWITHPIATYTQEARAADKRLQTKGISPRAAKNWGCIMPFIDRLRPYLPDFNFDEYMISHALAEEAERKDELLSHVFLEAIEGILAEERPTISGEHLHVEGDYLYMWFREVFVQIQPRWRNGFSKKALLEDIKGQPWYVDEQVRHPLGLRGERRRTLVLDITKGPPSLQNIAKTMS